METLIQGSVRTVTDRHTKQRRVCAVTARAREEARRNENTRSVFEDFENVGRTLVAVSKRERTTKDRTAEWMEVRTKPQSKPHETECMSLAWEVQLEPLSIGFPFISCLLLPISPLSFR